MFCSYNYNSSTESQQKGSSSKSAVQVLNYPAEGIVRVRVNNVSGHFRSVTPVVTHQNFRVESPPCNGYEPGQNQTLTIPDIYRPVVVFRKTR